MATFPPGPQRDYFSTGATRSYAFRKEQLKKLYAGIQAHEEEILQALYADLKKPRLEAFGSEIGILYEEIRFAIKNLKEWMEPERFSTPLLAFPAKSYLYREPLGVVLIISPWNYPFQLLIAPLIGAMAAGNCAVLKPSELAPATSAIIAKTIRATFPENYIAVIEGGKDETEQLLQQRWDHIFFTGGLAVAKIIMTAAAKHLTPCTFELGGKSPVIVDKSADLELAAKRIAWGKFFNAGQTCVAPDYVLVEKAVEDKLVAQIKKTVASFFGEDPQQSKNFARIINNRHFNRLKALIDQDKVVAGGTVKEEELYIAPTVMRNVSETAPVMQEEIFGPLLPIIAVDSVEEAITFVNKRAKPLAFYYFGKKNEQKVIDEISFGGGCMNDVLVHLSNPKLPFGGVGDSGMGGYHGKFSFDLFSHKKSVMKQSRIIDLAMRYPPYSDLAMTLVRKLQKGFL